MCRCVVVEGWIREGRVYRCVGVVMGRGGEGEGSGEFV